MDGMHLMRKKMDELLQRKTPINNQWPLLTIHLTLNETFEKSDQNH
jgi:hypothetical protein